MDKNGIKFQHTGLPDVIKMKNVCQSYDGGKTWIIKDFNLLIEDMPNQGQFVTILGPSGCGKTTILRYLSGLQTPTSGEILINDKPLEESIPMVFQLYSSLPWLTVLENVMLPLRLKDENDRKRPNFTRRMLEKVGFKDQNFKEHRELARQMLDKVGLIDQQRKYAQYPLLSGGQLQRVAIARSLIFNPRIILMDEPFGALDVNTRFQMQMMLTNLWESMESTIIFVTHDIQEAVFLSDYIFVMDSNPGRIVQEFHVELPFPRRREIKKDPMFMELVSRVEDCLFFLKDRITDHL